MKKHEACHWINEIIAEQRRELDRMKAALKKDGRDEREVEYYKKEVLDTEAKLKALDMAGDALTRGR